MLMHFSEEHFYLDIRPGLYQTDQHIKLHVNAILKSVNETMGQFKQNFIGGS